MKLIKLDQIKTNNIMSKLNVTLEVRQKIMGDAVNVYDKCGKLPSELLAENEELRKSLTAVLSLYTGTANPSTRAVLEAKRVLNQIQ